MSAFDLQTLEAEPALQALGHVQLRELSYGDMREAMRTSGATDAADVLLGRCLLVDGEPIGLARLRALPGRLAGALARSTVQVMRLHGLAEPASAEAPGEDAPEGEA
jgi:hypothetical protein